MTWVAECLCCGARIAAAPVIGDEEAEIMRAHLEVVHPKEYQQSRQRFFFPKTLPFAGILEHYRLREEL